MAKSIRIILIEDHPEFRETIEFVVNKEPNMELLAQFGNAELALRALEKSDQETNADIILLDLNLPGMSGLEAIPWILKYRPKARILILSQSDRESDILKAIHLGVSGYLLKSSPMDTLISSIQSVDSGGSPLDPSVATFILDTLNSKLPKVMQEIGLSKREFEVLQCVAEGLSQKETAKKLKLSTYTVTDHLKNIYEKLNVRNAPEAVSKAFKSGILSV